MGATLTHLGPAPVIPALRPQAFTYHSPVSSTEKINAAPQSVDLVDGEDALVNWRIQDKFIIGDIVTEDLSPALPGHANTLSHLHGPGLETVPVLAGRWTNQHT
jgi:hypothetical protein